MSWVKSIKKSLSGKWGKTELKAEPSQRQPVRNKKEIQE